MDRPGGYLAALYAARHPEVERLVLMAPAFGFGGGSSTRSGRGKGELAGQRGRAVFNYSTGAKSGWWRLIEDALEFEEFRRCGSRRWCFTDGGRSGAYALSEEFARRHTQARLELLDDGTSCWERGADLGVARAFLA